MSSICTAVMLAGLVWACDSTTPERHTYLARLDDDGIEAHCRPGRDPAWRLLGGRGMDVVGFRQRPGTNCRFELEIPADARLSFSVRATTGTKPGRARPRAAIALIAGDEERVEWDRSFANAGPITLWGDNALVLEPLDRPATAIEFRNLAQRRSSPIEWTDLVLEVETDSPEPPRGWRRAYADAIADFAAEIDWPPLEPARRRLLVIGIDGANWPLLDELIAAGDLPNLAELRARGVRGRLASSFIPESAMAWTTLRTGVTAGEHGVFHFLSPDRIRTSYWRWLDEAGLRSIVIGVPKSAPDEPFDGILVGGWNLDASARYTHPTALARHLADTGYQPSIANVPDVVPFTRRMRDRTDLALALLQRLDWDHAFVVYEYADTAGHRFGLRTKGWRQAYRRLDAEIGRLLEGVGPGTGLMLVSDHGWKRFDRAFSPDAWLRANGFTNWQSNIYGGHRVALRPASALSADEEITEITRLRAALAGLRDPDDDRRVVARVWRLDEAIPGPMSEASPLRIVIELEPGYHAAAKARGDAVWPDGQREHHDVDGMYLLVAPGIEPGIGPEANVLDVAPSAAAWFGVAPPADLPGRPILDWQPATPRRSEPAKGRRDTAGGDATGPDVPSAELRESLRALGYIDEGD